jgi:hypothetical protein
MTADELEHQLDRARVWHAGGWTHEEGAALLLGQVSLQTMRRWRRDGSGPACYHAHRWLYSLTELAQWLNARKSPLTGDQR